MIGIVCPIDQDMLAKGRDTHKYFTKNHMLYERNQVLEHSYSWLSIHIPHQCTCTEIFRCYLIYMMLNTAVTAALDLLIQLQQ